MQFTVLTLFPDLVDSFFTHGIIARAREKGLITGASLNIRDFSLDRHKTVDDKPYGGGAGMVMKSDPLARAIRFAGKDFLGSVKEDSSESTRGNTGFAGEKSSGSDSRDVDSKGAWVVMLSPQGRPFDQEKALEFASEKKDLIFVCGRYEGIDERISHAFIDEELSIGDYVMTGGELAAMVIIDSVTRLLPGVLGCEDSAKMDSFRNERLEYAHYTRPFEFEGMKVPDVLISGNHGKIEKWRTASSLKRTFLKRPDLFSKRELDNEEKVLLKAWCQELEALI
ncbi:MAG: tRNA (guanosine(37)-N1)-methyltransferase TrmD [Thermodesulfobacteriota bacterium]|nr:tRNA (guanosine(37)-N1)-methyltransferase TrmD [Thermodesulfobacteriota bacterium]